jgi:hypothetical protein
MVQECPRHTPTLSTWGRAVSIVAPDTLRSVMAEMTTTAAHHHAGAKLAAPP